VEKKMSKPKFGKRHATLLAIANECLKLLKYGNFFSEVEAGTAHGGTTILIDRLIGLTDTGTEIRVTFIKAGYDQTNRFGYNFTFGRVSILNCDNQESTLFNVCYTPENGLDVTAIEVELVIDHEPVEMTQKARQQLSQADVDGLVQEPQFTRESVVEDDKTGDE
jgi:hypothetical protein